MTTKNTAEPEFQNSKQYTSILILGKLIEYISSDPMDFSLISSINIGTTNPE